MMMKEHLSKKSQFFVVSNFAQTHPGAGTITGIVVK
jgi:hypothetical protein